MAIVYLKNEIVNAGGAGTPALKASVVPGVVAGSWADLVFPLTSASVPAAGLNSPAQMLIMDSAGTTGLTSGIYNWGFINSREDSLLFAIQMPHGYLEGTDLKAHVHWTMTTTTTGTVRWGIEYFWGITSGQFDRTVVANAANTRQRSGTTARLTFTVPHGMVVGQNIVVASAGSGDYNGNYIVTNFLDTNPYWIEYTIASGTESPTVDSAVNVRGYTVQIEATHTLSTNSQYKSLITSIGIVPGATGHGNANISNILMGRFYRPVLGGHIAERISALSMDFHFQRDTAGSIQEFSKT